MIAYTPDDIDRNASYRALYTNLIHFHMIANRFHCTLHADTLNIDRNLLPSSQLPYILRNSIDLRFLLKQTNQKKLNEILTNRYFLLTQASIYTNKMMSKNEIEIQLNTYCIHSGLYY